MSRPDFILTLDIEELCVVEPIIVLTTGLRQQ